MMDTENAFDASVKLDHHIRTCITVSQRLSEGSSSEL